jgi:hypothetical protein
MATVQEKKHPVGGSSVFGKPGASTDIFKSIKLPSLRNELQATRRATKEKGDKKPKKIFSSTALNLPVQYVGACKINERSKNRKAYFRMGNLSMLTITGEASPYAVQDPENPHIIRLYPAYNSLTLMQWPKLDACFPLDPNDCIVLESDKVYVISVDPELCEDMKAGEFLELVDVRFSVFASRDELPDRIKDKYKNANGKGVSWKSVPEEELAWSPKTHTIKPNFFFNAKSYKALPSVSTESILKVFDNRGLISHFIPKPTEEQLAFYTRNAKKYSPQNESTEGKGLPSEVYDAELDAMVPAIAPPSLGDAEGDSDGRMVIYQDAVKDKTKAEAFRMPDRFTPIPIFLVPFDGSESGEPMQHFCKDTGTIQTLETYYVSSDEINKHDAEKDKEETKRLQNYKVPGIYEKCWRFTFDVIQAEYNVTFGEDGQPSGFDDTPVKKENVMCRMNIYERTIDGCFGIYEDKTWERFVVLYKPYFHATIQCQANWVRTKSRMERIQSISSGGHSSFVVTGMNEDMGGDVGYAEDSSSLNYSHAFEWNADHIIFNLREMIASIGVPISATMADNFAKRLGYLRRQGKAPHGTYSDVKNMKVWNTHAVACMNAFSDHGQAVRYIESELEKQYYLVLLPTKLLSGAFSKGIYSWPEGSTEMGDQLVSILYDIDPENPTPRDPSKTTVAFDPSIHDPRVGDVADCLIKSDFKTDKDVLTALLFAVWPINESSFAHEAEAVAKFLGIPDQVAVVDAALHPEKAQDAELAADIGNTGSEEGHAPEEEDVDIYPDDMMEPSQQMLGSLEQQELDEGMLSIDPVAEGGEEMEEDSVQKRVEIREDANITHEVPRKSRKRPSRSSGDRRSKKPRSPGKRRGGR